MKYPVVKSLLSITAVLSLATSAAQAGTDVLHLHVRGNMSNEGAEASASGSVDARQNRQGNANNQKLGIEVEGLAANATYELLAVTGDDTNSVFVTDFTTDENGDASLNYQSKGNGKGKGSKKKTPLPAELNPISGIREISVFSQSATQTVLRADLTSPDRLQYLIKRDISEGGVKAALRVKANHNQSQFRLRLSGLAATNEYWLVLNGGIVETNTSDADGRLTIDSWLVTPADVLDVRTVELWNTSSNVVVGTELP